MSERDLLAAALHEAYGTHSKRPFRQFCDSPTTLEHRRSADAILATPQWSALRDAIVAEALGGSSAAPTDPQLRKAFEAFVAEVYVAHGYGPDLGQSHSPCDICRAIANARRRLGTEPTDR